MSLKELQKVFINTINHIEKNIIVRKDKYYLISLDWLNIKILFHLFYVSLLHLPSIYLLRNSNL